MSLSRFWNGSIATLFALCAMASKAASPNTSSPSAAPSPPANSITSIWRDLPDSQPKEIPKKSRLVLLCYKAKESPSVAQPFVLTEDSGDDEDHCSTLKSDAPLMMGDLLYFRIETTDLENEFRIGTVTISMSIQAGLPINPSPLRASVAIPTPSSSGATNKILLNFAETKADPSRSITTIVHKPDHNYRYVRWPYPLPSDSTLTATIAFSYSVPAPGADYVQSRNYLAGDVVKDNGKCYLALSGGIASAAHPDPDTTPSIQMRWTDTPCGMGTDPPTEKSVTVFNQALPPVHALSKFNLSAGVVYSTIRNHTYAFNKDSTVTIPLPIVETSSNHIIDPVLFFTYYPHAIDAERSFQASDLIPGISLGISLSSPSSNFYLGGVSEFFTRNVQLQYGFTVAKVARLADSATVPAASTQQVPSPPTAQKFVKGAYVGLSFNFTGFVSGLFGGGKSGG